MRPRRRCSPRGLRSLEYGCNLIDSRHDSFCYATRLEKYAKRYGFAVALPGYQRELVSRTVLERPYVVAPCYDMLFRVEEVGKPEASHTTIHYTDRSATLAYSMRHAAKLVTGAERFVAQTHSSIEVKTIHTPEFGHTCPNCDRLVAEPASKTGAVVITTTGLPGRFHLLFDCALPDRSDDDMPYGDLPCDDEEGCHTLDGYACTPLAKACAQFRGPCAPPLGAYGRPTTSSTRR